MAAAPFGSAGILPISWMYIRMMGCVRYEAVLVTLIGGLAFGGSVIDK